MAEKKDGPEAPEVQTLSDGTYKASRPSAPGVTGDGATPAEAIAALEQAEAGGEKKGKKGASA